MIQEIRASWGRLVSIGLPVVVSQGTNAVWGVVTLLVARVLPEQQYAAFSLAKTVEILAVTIGGGFVMQALLKYASEGSGRRAETVNSAAALALALTVAGAGLLLACGGLIQSFYSEIPLAGLPVVLSLMVLSEGICAIPRNNLLAVQKTRQVMWGDITGFAVRISIVLFLALSGRLSSPHPIFLAQTLSNAACLLVLVRGGGRFFERGARVARESLARVWRFSVYTLGTSLAAYVYSWTDILMLGRMAPGDVATYGVARSLTMFVASLNQAANIVLLPLASRMHTTGRTPGVAARTWQGIILVEAVQLPFIAVFAIFPRQILDLLFEGRYNEGWAVVTVLALLNLVKPVGSLFSSTACGLGRPEYSLRSVLLTALLNVGLNALLIPRLGGLGAAYATVVSMMAGGLAIYLAVTSYLKRHADGSGEAAAGSGTE
ncbi:MAG TPA: oligosaccharide flippase family protein [Candidatus Fermentibacter sp.]|nr:oligosaccharide flippase family protein [Candidatus Fermentibacter sp.]